MTGLDRWYAIRIGCDLYRTQIQARGTEFFDNRAIAAQRAFNKTASKLALEIVL